LAAIWDHALLAVVGRSILARDVVDGESPNDEACTAIQGKGIGAVHDNDPVLSST
jgi:hypothetical protein